MRYPDSVFAHRKYTIDQEFFAVIDSESKAYWLGFIYADGCIYGHELMVGLAPKDADHLRELAKALGTNRPVAVYPKHNTARFTVKSRQLTLDLNRHGVTPRKSLTAVPPILRADLQRHFWRGVFDGDGNIYIPRPEVSQNPMVRLLGSEDTCRAFAHFVEPAIGKLPRVRSDRGIHMVALCGSFISAKVCAVLYDDSHVYLLRKFNAALNIRGRAFVGRPNVAQSIAAAS